MGKLKYVSIYAYSKKKVCILVTDIPCKNDSLS